MKKIGQTIIYNNKKQKIIAREEERDRIVYLIKDYKGKIDVIDEESLKKL